MKHKPIEKPVLVGCLNCSPIPDVKLPKDTDLDVGVGDVSLSKNGKTIWNYMRVHDDEPYPTVADLEKLFEHYLQQEACYTLHFNGPLRDETYEYNKEDKEWYLIKQGMGFA